MISDDDILPVEEMGDLPGPGGEAGSPSQAAQATESTGSADESQDIHPLGEVEFELDDIWV